MNAVAACVDGVPAWDKTEAPCVSGLTLGIWWFVPLNDCSGLLRERNRVLRKKLSFGGLEM